MYEQRTDTKQYRGQRLNIDKDQTTTSRNTSGRIKENILLIVLMALGIGIVVYGLIPPYDKAVGAFGSAFIIASFVGIYMMMTTHDVARKLHERFNDQNAILGTHTVILKEIVSTQKEMSSSLKEISSTQKEIVSTQKEMSSSLKEISSTQKEMSSSLKELSSTQKEMSSTLKSIDNKIEQKL